MKLSPETSNLNSSIPETSLLKVSFIKPTYRSTVSILVIVYLSSGLPKTSTCFGCRMNLKGRTIFVSLENLDNQKRNYNVDDARSGLEDDTCCALKWFDLFCIKSNHGKFLFKYSQSYKCA